MTVVLNCIVTMLLSKLHNILKPFSRRFSTPVERKIKLPNGEEINFVKAGNGEFGVLLMPGALGSAWSDFKPQIESLPQLLPKHTFIAWDPPGYGQSIPPMKTFPIDFYHRDAKSAKNLMCELGFQRFSALGWSDGGITALILAGKMPEVIEKLVVWGASSYINEDEMKALDKMRDVSKWSQRMREPMEKIYGSNFPQLWADWIDGAIRIYNENNGDYCRNEIKNIKAPTLIIHGKKDAMIASEHVPYLRKAIKGNEYFEFPDGKHNVHLKYHTDFNTIVANFLKK